MTTMDRSACPSSAPVASSGALYLSTRPEGGAWTTHDDDGPLSMSVFGTGRFERSDDLIQVDIELQ